MPNSGRATATVSGSFHRAMAEVAAAVEQLVSFGIEVLSPADPRIVDQFADFLFVASDRVRVIRLVQQRHLAAIAASDFLWVVAPDGYVGPSTAMEIGYAHAQGTPVFSATPLADLTLRQFVTPIHSPVEALALLTPEVHEKHFLLDPDGSLQRATQELDVIAAELARPRDRHDSSRVESAAQVVRHVLSGV